MEKPQKDAHAAFRRELLLLRQRWHIILVCLCLQYVHGIFTQLAYRMHRPAEQPLHDMGFALIPELPAHMRWVSEALFASLLLLFIVWTFTPLLGSRSFSCVVLWTRLLTILVVCQTLRIISFSSTQLPGPAPHCRLGTPTAHRAPASVWWQHLTVDLSKQLTRSCGDLIFSSHITFVLLGVLTYQHYGTRRFVKAAAWLAALALSLLIIAARKHYTVDIVIAWYTVPLVFACLHFYWYLQQQRLLQRGKDKGDRYYHYYSSCSSREDCPESECISCCKPLKQPNSNTIPPQQVDADSIVIAMGMPVGKVPVSLHLPSSQPTSPSWPMLGAMWARNGHRRASSGGGTRSSSSCGCSSPSSSSFGAVRSQGMRLSISCEQLQRYQERDGREHFSSMSV